MSIPNRSTFETIYAGQPPWDIGKPQKAFIDVADQITGSILDAGCGTGDNALFFAKRGHKVTGIDFLDEPITGRRQKATERGLSATFLVMDALTLKDLPEVFDNVIDSGLFHVFSDDDRRRYVEGLATVLKPGGRLFLLCFSDEEPGEQGPRERSVPIFPELRQYLEEVFNAAEPGTVYVINNRCGDNPRSLLRGPLQRILQNAGVKRWPKLYQNLRSPAKRNWSLNTRCTSSANGSAIVPSSPTITTCKSQKAISAHCKKRCSVRRNRMHNAVQTTHAPERQELTEANKSLENKGFLQALAKAVNSRQCTTAPVVGVSPYSLSEMDPHADSETARWLRPRSRS